MELAGTVSLKLIAKKNQEIKQLRRNNSVCALILWLYYIYSALCNVYNYKKYNKNLKNSGLLIIWSMYRACAT